MVVLLEGCQISPFLGLCMRPILAVEPRTINREIGLDDLYLVHNTWP